MKTLGLLVLAVAFAAGMAYAGCGGCGHDSACGHSEGAGVSAPAAAASGTEIKAGQCATCTMQIPEAKGVAITDANGNTMVYCETCAGQTNVPVEVTSN